MEKRSAKQRKSREEGETKGRETSGQLDLPAIPNKTERGNEFTRISKKVFLFVVKPLSTKYTNHCNWSLFDKVYCEKAKE